MAVWCWSSQISLAKFSCLLSQLERSRQGAHRQKRTAVEYRDPWSIHLGKRRSVRQGAGEGGFGTGEFGGAYLARLAVSLVGKTRHARTEHLRAHRQTPTHCARSDVYARVWTLVGFHRELNPPTQCFKCTNSSSRALRSREPTVSGLTTRRCARFGADWRQRMHHTQKPLVLCTQTVEKHWHATVIFRALLYTMLVCTSAAKTLLCCTAVFAASGGERNLAVVFVRNRSQSTNVIKHVNVADWLKRFFFFGLGQVFLCLWQCFFVICVCWCPRDLDADGVFLRPQSGIFGVDAFRGHVGCESGHGNLERNSEKKRYQHAPKLEAARGDSHPRSFKQCEIPSDKLDGHTRSFHATSDFNAARRGIACPVWWVLWCVLV